MPIISVCCLMPKVVISSCCLTIVLIKVLIWKLTFSSKSSRKENLFCIHLKDIKTISLSNNISSSGTAIWIWYVNKNDSGVKRLLNAMLRTFKTKLWFYNWNLWKKHLPTTNTDNHGFFFQQPFHSNSFNQP